MQRIVLTNANQNSHSTVGEATSQSAFKDNQVNEHKSMNMTCAFINGELLSHIAELSL